MSVSGATPTGSPTSSTSKRASRPVDTIETSAPRDGERTIRRPGAFSRRAAAKRASNPPADEGDVGQVHTDDVCVSEQGGQGIGEKRCRDVVKVAKHSQPRDATLGVRIHTEHIRSDTVTS